MNELDWISKDWCHRGKKWAIKNNPKKKLTLCSTLTLVSVILVIVFQGVWSFSNPSFLKEMIISLCSHVIMLTNANFISTQRISSLFSLSQLHFLWLLSQVTLALSVRIIFDEMETGTWKPYHQCLWNASSFSGVLLWNANGKMAAMQDVVDFIFPSCLDECCQV